MTRQFNVMVERDAESYLVASVPSLPGCHSQGKTMEEVIQRITEAIGLCLEVQGRELLAALQKPGFSPIRANGSHHFVRHADGRATDRAGAPA